LSIKFGYGRPAALAEALAEALALDESFFGFLLGLEVFQTATFFDAIILPI
jgi:hypothetical protein